MSKRPLPKFYSTREVAQMFGVTPTTVVTWIKAKKLNARKVNNLWRVSEDDLNKFLDGQFGPVREGM